MSCPCDKGVHPPQLKIAAGLKMIPRQIAAFPEFRSDMLAALRSESALAAWRARGEDDLGIMLLEMWAYVCDSLAFYDEVIAHEVYLRTARRRPSLRRLVRLLGYIPCPAVAASVKLAVFVEGRKPVALPSGTAFRSGAFDGESPQVFELDADTKIHPFINRFTLERPRPSTIGTSVNYLLLETGTASLKVGDIVLVQVQNKPAWTQVRIVRGAATIQGQDEEKYLKLTFGTLLTFPGNTAPAQVKLSTPTQTADLWTSPANSENPSTLQVDGEQTLKVILDNVYRQIKPADFVILVVGTDYRWFKVTGTSERMMEVTAGGPVETLDENGNVVNVVVPPVSTPATQLVLAGNAAGWTSADAPKVVVHYNLVTGGVVTVDAKTTLLATDLLEVAGNIEEPTGYTAPSRFLLEDKNEMGVEIGGGLDFSTGTLALDQGTEWSPALVAPVELYGNVVSASRGETINGEVLGSGDASVSNQSFTLKKKSLTYKASPAADNERGVASTLQIYVNGILWSEVPSFFGIKHDAQVYVVRQNDEGESAVTFGDGQHGARLPTGTDNVIANYRYGAGEASPPAGSIMQLAKPTKGLKSVRNPVAAFGGEDAESAKDLRKYAPASALILGRAVSIKDMEAVAAGVAGVRAVRVEWRWHSDKQRPVVQVWYIGEAGVATTVAQTLRGLSDPTTPIGVEVAQGLQVQLSLDIDIEVRYLEAKVLAAIRTKLMDKKTGLLSPEQIGIGLPLYRSCIFEAVVSVPGANSVTGILWNGEPFDAFAISPGAGKYFDLESGALLLNGKAA